MSLFQTVQNTLKHQLTLCQALSHLRTICHCMLKLVTVCKGRDKNSNVWKNFVMGRLREGHDKRSKTDRSLHFHILNYSSFLGYFWFVWDIWDILISY
jgi:hypothetical protein